MTQKRRKDWTKVTHVAVFCVVLVVMGVLFMTLPRLPVSTVENRQLTAMPTWSWNEFFFGSYTQEMDLFVADQFPFREDLVSFSFWLKQHLGVPSEEMAFYHIALDDEGDDLESLGDEPIESGTVQNEVLVAEPVEDTPEPTPVTIEPPKSTTRAPEGKVSGLVAMMLQQNENGNELKRDRITGDGPPPATEPEVPTGAAEGIIVVEGRAMQTFSGKNAPGKAYGKTINAHYDAVKGKVRLFSMIVPSPAAFYLPSKHRRRTRSEKPYIESAYSHLHPKIHRVDAFSEMAPHSRDYLYFRTDHHWTALGAYYAYRGFCKSAGWKPLELNQFEKRTGYKVFMGSLYKKTQDRRLRKRPDRMEYYVPPVTHTAERFYKGSTKKSSPASFLEEKFRGYLVFLGGDYPLMIAKTSVTNGKTAMLVKNSYGNPFAIYLLSHYENVLVVDYRYQKQALSVLVDRYDVDDLVFLNGVVTSAAFPHLRLMKGLVRGRK
jgi:hypothetical protein